MRELVINITSLKDTLENSLEMGWSAVDNPPANAVDMSLIPALGTFHMQSGKLANGPHVLTPISRALGPELLSQHTATTLALAHRIDAPQEKASQ